jgi:fatty-acid desaturase
MSTAKKLLIVFCESASKFSCTGIAAYMWGPLLVLVISQAALLIIGVMAHFFGEKIYLNTNITEIICTFNEILLCPYLHKDFMVQKKTME